MRLRSALSLLLVTAMLAAACGPDHASQQSSTTAVTTTSTSTEAPTTTLSPTTTTTISTTTTTTLPPDATPPSPVGDGTVLVVDERGVVQIDPAGKITRLVEGKVVTAVDDTRGGLLLQTDKGRRCFGSHDCADQPDVTATEIWWIPRGAWAPQQLLVPTPGTDHELTLRDAYRTDTGFVVLYTRHEGYVPFEHPPSMFDRLRSYDVDTGKVRDLYTVRGYEWDLAAISAGGGLITATEMQLYGSGCILIDCAGAPVTKPGVPVSRSCFDELEEACPTLCAVSSDGTRVAYVDQLTWDEPQVLVVAEVATGTELGRVALPASDGAWRLGLSLDGSSVLVNRYQWHDGGEVYARAAVYEIANLPAGPQELPLAGHAQLVTTPVDIDGPVPAPSLIELRSDGLGVVDFGDPTEEVRQRLTGVLGPPTSQWRGTMFTFHQWEPFGLIVGFDDEDFFRSDGVEHLVHWFLGTDGVFRTSAGIGIGATLDELVAAHPGQIEEPEFDDVCGFGWYVTLTDPAPRSDDRIIVLFGAAPAAGGRITSMMAGAGEGC